MVDSVAGLFLCFFSIESDSDGSKVEPEPLFEQRNQGLEAEGLEEDDDEELEDDSVKGGEAPRHQTRPPVRLRLLLALPGTRVLKHVVTDFSGLGNLWSYSNGYLIFFLEILQFFQGYD